MLVDFWSPIRLSIEIAVVSSIIVAFMGITAGRLMSRRSFRGKVLFETIFMLPLVLSPTVIGFLLIAVFGNRSPVGQAIESIFRQPIIFTWFAAIVASIVVAFPLMYQSARAGFDSVDGEIEAAARIDGASELKVFLYITIPLAYRALMTGGILSFTRALGEFGATLMFAGNIPGRTQTIPTAIYVAIDAGNMELAWLWVLASVTIAFLMLLVIQKGPAGSWSARCYHRT
jgi:molybdate transport system permease protein